ncbi:hypothetical protein J6590_038554 [Homalodisca vitripennis]|nr:hypothetical protein J6590_038554 [Homalodisca vitripennis]
MRRGRSCGTAHVSPDLLALSCDYCDDKTGRSCGTDHVSPDLLALLCEDCDDETDWYIVTINSWECTCLRCRSCITGLASIVIVLVCGAAHVSPDLLALLCDDCDDETDWYIVTINCWECTCLWCRSCITGLASIVIVLVCGAVHVSPDLLALLCDDCDDETVYLSAVPLMYHVRWRGDGVIVAPRRSQCRATC